MRKQIYIFITVKFKLESQKLIFRRKIILKG